MQTRIYCTVRFEGFHCWSDAPEEVAYLRMVHRHLFHVRVEKTVPHDDRAIEFHLFQHHVKQVIKEAQTRRSEAVRNWSCESWAKYLLGALDADVVEVSEDGENGAVVVR